MKSRGEREGVTKSVKLQDDLFVFGTASSMPATVQSKQMKAPDRLLLISAGRALGRKRQEKET